MLKSGLIIAALLLSWSAQAQQVPVVPRTTGPYAAPVAPGLSLDDEVVIQESISKLTEFLQQVNDQETPERIRQIQHSLAFLHAVDPRSLPIVGMALSRNSQDPRACALLQRIEPSAVCMK